MDIELRRTFELTAVLHVTKLPDGHIQLTVVPHQLRAYVFTGTSGGFDLQPPDRVERRRRLAGGARGPAREPANQAYLDFRTHSGLGPFAGPQEGGRKAAADRAQGRGRARRGRRRAAARAAARADAGDRQGQPAAASNRARHEEAHAAYRVAAVAPPAPLLAQAKVPVLPALPVDEAPAPPRWPLATPRPVLKAARSGGMNGGVSLQPFLAAADAPTAAGGRRRRAGPRPASGRPMRPGRLPPGPERARQRDRRAEPQRRPGRGAVYLTGQFVVRAVGENKAQGHQERRAAFLGRGRNVRVIVEYPSDRPLPAEGSEISRDDQRPYQIMDVRQVADGTLNVFAREISE